MAIVLLYNGKWFSFLVGLGICGGYLPKNSQKKAGIGNTCESIRAPCFSRSQKVRSGLGSNTACVPRLPREGSD